MLKVHDNDIVVAGSDVLEIEIKSLKLLEIECYFDFFLQNYLC